MKPPAIAQDMLPLGVPEPEAAAPAEPAEFAQPITGTRIYTVIGSPIGDLLLTGDGASLTGLYMNPEQLPHLETDPEWRREPKAFGEAEAQLRAYFAGELRTFSLPLAPTGTPFQLCVWQELTTIPYGRTTSYGSIANAIDRPSASRAVGMANGRNPISIIVPCHRIIGSNGSLTGYGGGLPRKQFLLRLERT